MFGEGKIPKASLVTLVVSALIGIAASVKLFFIDTALWAGLQEKPSFCNVSSFVNCDAVSMSDYSHFLGIPNAAWGIVIYSVILIALCLGILSRESIRRHLLRGIFIIGVVLSGAGICLAYLSIALIKALCLLCLVTYAVNICIAISSALLLKEGPINILKHYLLDLKNISSGLFKGKGEERGFSIKVLSILALSLIIAITGLVFLDRYFQKKTSTDAFDEDTFINEVYLKLPQVGATLSETTPSWGKKGAGVQIIEFSDFKCPFCRTGAFLVKNLLSQYNNRIELTFRNFPLDQSCNGQAKTTLHPGACLLAKSSICASRSNRFWEFNELLFQNSPNLTRPGLRELAKRTGIDPADLDDCLDDHLTKKILEQEINDAKNMGVSVTPTFVINGRVLNGLLPPAAFQAILRYELSKNSDDRNGH